MSSAEKFKQRIALAASGDGSRRRRCRPTAPVRTGVLLVDFFRTAGFVDWHHHNAHVLAGAAMSTIHWDYSAGCRADRHDSDRQPGA